MQKIKRNLHLVVIVGILFATGAVFANVFNGQGKIGATAVSADEEEQEKAEVKDDEDEKDEVENKEEENDREEKNNEQKRVKTKEIKNKTLKTGQKIEDTEDEEDENSVDGEEIDEEDENDAQEEIQELRKDINKVESKIGVLGANGVAVASFMVTLSEIKSLASQAETKMTTASAESEMLTETADKKLERLEKLVKMALGDEEDDEDGDETGKDATEKIQEVTKEAGRLEIKLNVIAETGKDVSSLKIALNIAKDLLSQAREKLTSGDFVTSESLAEMAEKKIESVKHSMELAYGDDDEEDGDEANEYKNEVAKFVHNLEDISQMDGGIGQQVRVVAQAQNASATKVESSINDIKGRSGLVKFLVGPKYGSIAEVQTAITENQTRIKVLSDLIGQVTDPVVKQVLQEQIGQFQQENTRLQAFITENESGVSLFGWLAKMFS